MVRATSLLSLFAVGFSANVPLQKLNNGVMMPVMSLGTWQFNSSTAEAAVKLALQVGFPHIDTAHNYNNQDGVGRALAGVDRQSYFLTTKVQNAPSGASADDATAYTKNQLADDLRLLGLDYVDLMLLHGPPKSCEALQAQWKALEGFYSEGKAKAIGVSNFCMSSYSCLFQTAKVVPTVNQIQYHVGMGADPDGLASYGKSKGIATQAYSPLGNGSPELITGELVTGIGSKHNISGAQVALRWIFEHGVMLTTKTTKQEHMEADLAIFDMADGLADEDVSKLDAATSPSGRPSWACTSSGSSVLAV